MGTYRWVDEAGIRARWDREIPVGNKQDWRPEAGLQAILAEALKWDAWGAKLQPPRFRAPNGTLVDLFEAFSGRPLYDARAVECPTLLIRGADDPTPADRDSRRLFNALRASVKRYVTIGQGTHFISAEINRRQLFEESWLFLK